MRTTGSVAALLAAMLASSGAGAADLMGSGSAPTVADFSGLGLGVDLGAAWDSTGPSNLFGGIGGAHVGYNLQQGSLVGGVEADAMYGSMQGRAFDGGSFSQDFLTSARFKGGFLFGSLLAYATIGWAWSTTDYTSLAGESSRAVPGLAYGGGVDFAVVRNVSLRAELLRYDFAGASYATPFGAQTVSTATNMFRLGATFHF
jgi:outer membrane immunogenic protein